MVFYAFEGPGGLFFIVFLQNAIKNQFLTNKNKKMSLAGLRSQKSRQNWLLVIQYGLPRGSLEPFWASSWDLRGTKISPLEAFWLEKASQRVSKQKKDEFLEILKKPWFFNDFSWFFKVLEVSFSYFFDKTISKIKISQESHKKLWLTCLWN